MKNTNNYNLIKFEDGEFSLDVNVSPSEDTVWLTQKQMALLFDVDRTRITRHVNNILVSKELPKSVCAENAHTASDGKTYLIKYYNLDMINSYIVNEKRCLECQENLVSLNNKVNTLINQTNDNTNSIQELKQPDTLLSDKLFYEGQIFDAYSYIKQFFLSAKASIILIDGYIDLSVLDMLVNVIVPITIYTYPNAQLTNLDIDRFNIKHSLEVFRTSKIHDRFIIIDNIIYLCGSSIKDVGKKRFVLTKLESINVKDLINNLTFVKKGKNNE